MVSLKHGYLITSDGELHPDGENFIIIKNAFQMLLEGVTLDHIVKWLDVQPYQIRKKGKLPTSYRWDKDTVSKMLRDPVYAGILKYSKNIARLDTIYDFVPTVSPEEYYAINKINPLEGPAIKKVTSKPRENSHSRLLRGIIYCGYCSKTLTSSLTTKSIPNSAETRKYYHYKCENKMCEYNNKSVRANIIVSFAIEFLETYLFTNRDNYEVYRIQARENIKYRENQINSEIISLTKMASLRGEEYERTKQLLLKNPALIELYDLGTLQNNAKDIVTQIDMKESRKLFIAKLL